MAGADRELRWGILGTGLVAGWFATQLQDSLTGRLGAVASRDASRAAAFASAYGGRAYDDYAALLSDPHIDVVYIALPNSFHVEWAIAAAVAGKHVLCEKPIALTADDAGQIFEAGRAAGVTVLEGFMYRVHPQMGILRDLLVAGEIGEVRMLEADFGVAVGSRDNIRRNRQLGGGALLDLGTYGVSLARMVAGAALGKRYGEPSQVRAVGRFDVDTGVDSTSVATLAFSSGLVASIASSIEFALPARAIIHGTRGRLTLANPWQPAFRGPDAVLILERTGGETEEIAAEADRPLYALEADAVAAAIDGREVPSTLVQPDDSVSNAQTLDAIRAALDAAQSASLEEGGVS